MAETKTKSSRNRWKNPWLWVGIIGVIGTALGVDGTTLTSWAALGSAFMGVIQNPFALGTVAMALLGAYVDPTTGGLKD